MNTRIKIFIGIIAVLLCSPIAVAAQESQNPEVLAQELASLEKVYSDFVDSRIENDQEFARLFDLLKAEMVKLEEDRAQLEENTFNQTMSENSILKFMTMRGTPNEVKWRIIHRKLANAVSIFSQKRNADFSEIEARDKDLQKQWKALERLQENSRMAFARKERRIKNSIGRAERLMVAAENYVLRSTLEAQKDAGSADLLAMWKNRYQTLRAKRTARVRYSVEYAKENHYLNTVNKEVEAELARKASEKRDHKYMMDRKAIIESLLSEGNPNASKRTALEQFVTEAQ